MPPRVSRKGLEGLTSKRSEARRTTDLRRVADNYQVGRGPIYSHIPKEALDNVRYRKRWCDYGHEKPEYAEDIRLLCRKDPLWYVNTFVWTFDPRKSPAVLPFITYDFQDTVILRVVDMVLKSVRSKKKRRQELLTEKSRDMGLTWCLLIALHYLWMFHDDMSFLLLSRKEEEVDDPTEHKALFQKLDFINRHLPGFLIPPTQRLKLRLKNLSNNSSFGGESTNSNAGRSNRATLILLDEFGVVENGGQINQATAHTTYNRIFNGTVQAGANEFNKLRKGPIEKIRIHWSQHPEKNQGLYTSQRDDAGEFQLKVIDGEFDPKYKYVLDGKLRSPWYDAECDALNDPALIARELDIDDAGGGKQFFEDSVIDRVRALHSQPPWRVGNVQHDPKTMRVAESIPFRDDLEGTTKLWCVLDSKGRPPRQGRYRVACDIATGTGASNSVLVVGNLVTREKVAEYAFPKIKPEAFARFAMTVGYWFSGLDDCAELVWEANGPGRIFGDLVLEQAYPRFYTREHKGAFRPEHAGWYSDPEERSSALANYRDLLSSGAIYERSSATLDECRDFIYKGTEIIHSGSTTDDPSGAKANHGDRVTATMLLWLDAAKTPQTLEEADDEIRPYTLAWRNERSRRQNEDESLW